MTVQAATVRSASPPTKARWRSFCEANPKVRIRDAAQALGVSEAALVATGCGDSCLRLTDDFRGMIQALPKLGQVMALTRNDSAVHEKHGAYGNVDVSGHAGLVLNDDIDLRLFLRQWKFGFAVTEEVTSGTRRSLQFFSAQGVAIHKVYCVDASESDAYDSLRHAFAADDQNGDIDVAPATARAVPKPNSDIDVAGFRNDWAGLQDTHDFFGLLHKHGVTRTQGLRLGGSDLAYQVQPTALRRCLELAAERDIPIMVFVGNPGAIQIHTGPVHRLKAMGPWFNVLDEGFNLHLREDHIDTAWIVRKPTRDGTVTSLELYDRAGEAIATLFGKRKPGLPELQDWRTLVGELPEMTEPASSR